MKPAALTTIKVLVLLPICLATLLGPFFLANWLQSKYGIFIPTLVILAIALSVTLFIYFGALKKDIRAAEDRWRSRKQNR